MAYRPNFGAVVKAGDFLELNGQTSDPGPPEHMLIYVRQDDALIASGIVGSFGDESGADHWKAAIPIESKWDPGQKVLCFGVEINTDPQFAAVTWSQLLPILT